MKLDNIQTGKPGRLKVLVTGATGFLGGRLTEQLTGRGFRVRALARKSSNTAKLRSAGVEIFFGDVREVASLKLAMTEMDVVIHAAADTSADARRGQSITVSGTLNVVNSALAMGIRRFIYLSTCNVYGVSKCQPGQMVDETGPLESHPEARGHYTDAKFKAEQIVLEAMQTKQMAITCLRPGTIWGPGAKTFTPMMGFKLGTRVLGIIGFGSFVLPLVYLDNLVNAIIKCIDHPGAYNKVFNIVDPQPVDKATYTDKVLKPLFPKAHIFRIPYGALYAAVGCQEILCRIIGRKPFLTRYRLISSQRPIRYDSSRIMQDLDWYPPVSFHDAVREVLRYENESKDNLCVV